MARPAKSETGKGNVEWTREQLISAAARQFALFGYEGASLSKIREKVGVKNSTIHYHFGSKQGLYDAVTDHLVVSLEEFISDIVQHSQCPPMERLLLLIERFQKWGNKEQDYTAIIFQEMMSKQLLSAANPFYQSIGQIFQQVIGFIEGNDSQEVWREVDWTVFIVNLLFSILMGQAVSIAAPLAFNLNQDAYQQKQLDDVVLTQMLSLSLHPEQARTFLKKQRPSCL